MHSALAAWKDQSIQARRSARNGRLGAMGLYVSATTSENTVDFYRRRGCRVTPDADPKLLALEPEDIHFECRRFAKSHT